MAEAGVKGEAARAGGLRNVVAGQSAISTIDGQRGILSYRGIDIHELAEHASFEETVFLLHEDRLPTAAELAQLSEAMAGERGVPEPVLALLRSLPPGTHPMAALRTAVSALGAYDPDAGSEDAAARRRLALRLVAQTATLVAAIERARHRLPLPEPDRALGHAGNFLYMLTGQRPQPEAEKALDVALVLHADHEFNASTFAARVAVATRADLHSAIVAAIATLKGPSHGGANEDVLLMLREIGDPAKAEAFVESRLGRRDTLSRQQRTDPKSRVPGFGHRVYRVDDARARVLRGMARGMAEATGRTQLFEVAEAVYAAVTTRTGLPVNVDFFSAVVYDALGIPPDFCTSIFAVGRVAGWCAHIMEQYADNRLIRPRADYIGLPARALP
jgi:2-methylcitrate synthase